MHMLPVAPGELQSDFLLSWRRVAKNRFDGQGGIFKEVEFLLQKAHLLKI